MTHVVTFGEIMLRLNPPGHQRLVQATNFEASYAGGEANVAVSLACLGDQAAYVTTVPANALGDCAVNALRRYGVDTTQIRRGGNRLGAYFVEKGASQRSSTVLYDRTDSAVAMADPSTYDWDQILDDADWLHLSGITPALSARAAQACRDAARTAQRLGVTVSCDLNYRSRLWSREAASAFMAELAGDVDVLVANEEDPFDVFGIAAAGTDIEAGGLDQAGYDEVARALTERFGFTTVAITLRQSISASQNDWSGLIHRDGQTCFAPTYHLTIVDRVGGGDSFAAGLIHALRAGMTAQESIDFAVGASCLKHSIEHDFNLVSVSEVEALIHGTGSGRIRR
ncbi:MAG: sugar kinase [Propionibacteriaceae bacterium]|jgi:2-dehydro-3-deoxygluconokinase|nr:sugar kinase [Propionibacteriaceae bacterium]